MRKKMYAIGYKDCFGVSLLSKETQVFAKNKYKFSQTKCQVWNTPPNLELFEVQGKNCICQVTEPNINEKSLKAKKAFIIRLNSKKSPVIIKDKDKRDSHNNLLYEYL